VSDPGVALAEYLEARVGDAEAISDDSFQRAMTAMIKLYAAKAERASTEIVPFNADQASTTEVVVTACAVIRGAGLNLFDVAMWFGRSAGGL
jgi:hypothetical protein